MRVGLDEVAPRGETVVGLGTFDGLHLGHRMLLGRVRALAEQREMQSAVLTFPKPPRSYLSREKRLILPPERKLQLLEEEVELVVVADFLKLRPLASEEFAQVLKNSLKTGTVVIGEDYRFGQGRRGDADCLRKLGHKLGFQVETLAKLLIEGRPVSSTVVRQAIEAGEIERARQWLGYPPLLLGPVIRGEERGRELGFPTANLRIDEELVTPREGVFVVKVKLGDWLGQGLLYIGRRPTFDGVERSFEVYILDFTAELYGEELEVSLLKRLRGDLAFPEPLSLQRQIKQDLKVARQFFTTGRDRGAW